MKSRRLQRIVGHLQVDRHPASLTPSDYAASATVGCHPASLCPQLVSATESTIHCHPAFLTPLNYTPIATVGLHPASLTPNPTSAAEPTAVGEGALFLGLDASTQGLKGTVINEQARVVYEFGVNFDRDLPHYGTEGGVIRDGDSVEAPSVMFAEALDLVLANLAKQQLPRSIVGVSVSGQQHGSVYWARGSQRRLRWLSPSSDLRPQLAEAFSKPAGAVWMDSSTAAYCTQMEALAGGAQRVADISGSRAYERFTGHQISKVFDTLPEVYGATERISLVSSMLPSLLIGDYAPIDYSDASGMNLMDFRTGDWSESLLRAAVSPPGRKAGAATDVQGLRARLGPVAPSHHVAGTVHSYFQRKYGFPPSCVVACGTGDNPSTVAGLKLQKPGDICISLGTSDTFFGVIPTKDVAPSGDEGHVLRNPIDPDSCFAMLCFKNGSLCREHVRDGVGIKDWAAFDKALTSTAAGNGGNVGFFFREPEIIPRFNRSAEIRFDAAGTQLAPTSKFSAATECRAVIEGQFLSMRLHSQALGLAPRRIIATGGGSVNKSISQVIANVFNTKVYTSVAGPNTAALGAAYRALHSYKCMKQKAFVPFSTLFGSDAGDLVLAAEPQAAAVATYTAMLPTYALLEKRALGSA